jgi:hypothetical protein
MKNVQTCPVCGRPQECEIWRHCSCGYDFGPGTQLAPIEPKEPVKAVVIRGRISARSTFFLKRIFPIFFSIVAGGMFLNPKRIDAGGWPLAIFYSLIAATVAFALVKRIHSVYTDEVFDDGDKLIIRNGGREDVVSFKDIQEVQVDVMRPSGITIHFRRDSIFGRSIKFLPSIGFLTFSKIADSLRCRVKK